jgi:hypothetical protein
VAVEIDYGDMVIGVLVSGDTNKVVGVCFDLHELCSAFGTGTEL